MKVQKEMRMRLKVGLLMAALLVAASAARADLVVTVGNHDLLPNTPGQVVQIFVTAQGGEAVSGNQLRAQLGDGGPDVGGTDVGPVMTGDIIGPGTIFESNNVGVSDNSLGPLYVDLGTNTTAGTIALSPGQNLWGTLIFDTTGFGPGFSMPLLLSGAAGGDSDMFPFHVTNFDPGFALLIENGSINIPIVPEPSSIVLGMFAVAGFGAVAIRRRRVRNA